MTYDTMPKGRLNMVRSCGHSETLLRFFEALVSIKPSNLTVLLARGTKCAVCGRGVGLRPGKQGYICRDCGLVTHKPCHVRAEVHCPNTTVPSLDLEYYTEEKKK